MDAKIDKNTLLLEDLNKKVETLAEVQNDVSQIKETVEGVRKDLNTVEIITSKNWNEIAHLKAVK